MRNFKLAPSTRVAQLLYIYIYIYTHVRITVRVVARALALFPKIPRTPGYASTLSAGDYEAHGDDAALSLYIILRANKGTPVERNLELNIVLVCIYICVIWMAFN